MRIGKEIKRDTQLIIISVIVLTIVTLSVSYSAFFTVQSLSTIQEISTGNLQVDVAIDNTKSMVSGEEIFPVSVEDIIQGTGNYSLLSLENNGDLNADFSVTISYDFDELRKLSGNADLSEAELLEQLVPFDYLNIGIYDNLNGKWINFSEGNGETLYPAIIGLSPSENDPNAYPILRSSIEANVTGSEEYQKEYKVFVWLSDETPTSEIGKYVYLKLNVKCAAGNETITETVEIIG